MTYRPRFFRPGTILLTVLTAVVVAGCGTSAPVADAYEAPPELIPYASVDLRHFQDVGEPVLTRSGSKVTVEAHQADTLLWFENAETGAFEQAFLRRGNNVYALGHTGDYRLSSATQSAIYSIILEQWRGAQRHYALRQ